MVQFYTSDDIIISPLYKHVQAYAVDFDYDLLGQPISRRQLFFTDPLPYIHRFLDQVLFVFVALVFGFAVFLVLCFLSGSALRALWRKVQNKYVTSRALSREYKISEERKKFLQREDHDRYAAVHCKSLVNTLGVATPRHPIPRDLPDYEAVRFVLPHPWLVQKTLKALQKAEFDPSWDRIVEGELEDLLKLAARRKLLARRAPLSLFGKLRARHLLSKGEVHTEGAATLTPEMLRLHGWEALYRKHLKHANLENFYWWLSQDKTLPVESREVVERLRPLIAKSRKLKQLSIDQQAEIVKQIVHDLTRLPHDRTELDSSGPVLRTRELSRPRIAISPPTLPHVEKKRDRPEETEESLVIREILGMNRIRRARLKRSRRKSSFMPGNSRPRSHFW